MNPTGFFAQDVATSKKGNFLWATSRSTDPSKRGWLTGLRLNEVGGVGSEPLFQVETATGGGHSNHLAASPFAENKFALAEAEIGALYIYAYANGTAGVVGSGLIGGTRDKAGGCCSDVVGRPNAKLYIFLISNEYHKMTTSKRSRTIPQWGTPSSRCWQDTRGRPACAPRP